MEMNSSIPKRYLNIEELSAYLGISVSLIYKKVEARQIPFAPVSGRSYRFDIRDIDEWVKKKKIPAAPTL